MTRRLPWKTSGDSASSSKKKSDKLESPSPKEPELPSAPATPAPPSSSRLRKTRREREIDSDGASSTTPRGGNFTAETCGLEGVRSSSTSPPPEVPVERFMIPLQDDRYRMVEDEFLNVAHQFTTHLHRAEYIRLKNLAKTQNAATIREIERPVVGTPTVLAQQRKDKARRVAKQRKVADVHGDEEGPAGLSRAETGLRGLLESPRKEAKWISATATGTATTRAAAGFGSNLSSPPRPRSSPKLFSSSRKRPLPARDDDETEESDDDLATPSRSRITKPASIAHSASSATNRSAAWPMSTPRAASSSSSINSPRPPPSSSRLAATPSKIVMSRGRSPLQLSNNHKGDDDDDDEEDEDEDPFGINKRRMMRQKSREQFRKVESRPPPKKATPDTIPSFI